jgi:hypothetical protein
MLKRGVLTRLFALLLLDLKSVELMQDNFSTLCFGGRRSQVQVSWTRPGLTHTNSKRSSNRVE